MPYQENGRYHGTTEQLRTKNLTSDGRLCHGGVCSRLDLIEEHIAKHRLNLTPEEYLTIADFAQNISSDSDSNGMHVVSYNGNVYRIVLNGEVKLGDSIFRIVRSVVHLGRQKELPFSAYDIKIRHVEKGQPRYIKPNLPEWSLLNVLDAMEKLKDAGVKKATYQYEQPTPHVIKIRRKITRVPKTEIVLGKKELEGGGNNMASPEIHTSLVHEIAAAGNIVIAQKENNPGSSDHASAIGRLTDTLANKPGALEALRVLQKGE